MSYFSLRDASPTTHSFIPTNSYNLSRRPAGCAAPILLAHAQRARLEKTAVHDGLGVSGLRRSRRDECGKPPAATALLLWLRHRYGTVRRGESVACQDAVVGNRSHPITSRLGIEKCKLLGFERLCLVRIWNPEDATRFKEAVGSVSSVPCVLRSRG